MERLSFIAVIVTVILLISCEGGKINADKALDYCTVQTTKKQPMGQLVIFSIKNIVLRRGGEFKK